jgi:1-acyl-sn-glycerol-3-phosphate acyltransferase
LRVAVVLAIYFVAAPFGYATFWMLRLIPAEDPDRRAARLQRVMQHAFATMHHVIRWLGLIDFHPSRIEGPIPDGPCVLVANHPSMADFSAIMASIGHVCTATRRSIYRSWWAHALLEGAAQFEGADENPLGAGELVDHAVDRLRRGFRVLVFPEGMRSPHGGLHRFGRMGFEIACKANVPVVPLIMTCEPVWLTRERTIFRPPDGTPRMSITALPSLLPEAHGFSSRALRDVVEAVVRKHLSLPAVRTEEQLDFTHGGISRIASEEPNRQLADA